MSAALEAFLAALIDVVTLGVSWIIYPFFARSIIPTYYGRIGWKGPSASEVERP